MLSWLGIRPKWIAPSLLAWAAFGLFFFTQDVARASMIGDRTPWWNFLLSWTVAMALNALLSPFVLALGTRVPIGRLGWPWRVALHLGSSVVFSLVHLSLFSAVLTAFPIRRPP